MRSEVYKVGARLHSKSQFVVKAIWAILLFNGLGMFLFFVIRKISNLSTGLNLNFLMMLALSNAVIVGFLVYIWIKGGVEEYYYQEGVIYVKQTLGASKTEKEKIYKVSSQSSVDKIGGLYVVTIDQSSFFKVKFSFSLEGFESKQIFDDIERHLGRKA